jgi:hypothetical protein
MPCGNELQRGDAFSAALVVIMAGDKHPTFLTKLTATCVVIEAGLAATTSAMSACDGWVGEEKKVGEHRVLIYLKIW